MSRWARSILVHPADGMLFKIFSLDENVAHVLCDELDITKLIPPKDRRVRIQFARNSSHGIAVVFMYADRKPPMLARSDAISVGYFEGTEAAEVAAIYARMLI